MEPKVKKIYIEMEDGVVLSAEGDAAESVYEWWQACEMMMNSHGFNYEGTCLTRTPKKVEETPKE